MYREIYQFLGTELLGVGKAFANKIIQDQTAPVSIGTFCFTNSEDQGEMPHDAAFHQGLQCLLKRLGL